MSLQKIFFVSLNSLVSVYNEIQPLKGWGRGQLDSPLYFFKKWKSSRERVKHWFFLTFNIIISHFFSEIFIETLQVFQMTSRISPPIWTILIDFSDFLTFFYYNKKLLTSAWFSNNCIKINWYYITSSWNIKEGVVKLIPTEKNHLDLEKTTQRTQPYQN